MIARFARSVYVATGGGLACIGSPAIGRGPLNLIARLGKALPEPGERVACGRGTVRFSGGLALALAGASTWTPPPPPLARRARLRLPRIAPPFPEAAAALKAWLQAGGRGPLPPAVAGVVGRGDGLTPAGDDLLGGALVALCALGERALARRLARPVLAAARAGTSRISRAHLACAAQGAGHEALHAALAAILDGGRGLGRALAALARVGHTSGRDALAGALLALSAWRARTRARRSPAQATTKALR
ncbi:MAG: DUF2877 domain-containing protein [Burkholderiales bacterium]|nr:DUF2877 domain-containing protein [Burkholderiales bacterium]